MAHIPSALLKAIWLRKWLLLVPAVLVGSATAVASSLLPVRYQSEASILIVPQRVPQEYVRSTVTRQINERMRDIGQRVLSRTRLKRIITDLNIYDRERKTMLIEEVVDQMRRNIRLDIGGSGESPEAAPTGLRVSFISQDPRTALKVTERLTATFIEESLRDREVLAEGTSQFIEAMLEDVRRQVIECEKKLQQARSKSGGQTPSRVLTLEYEVLQDTYKTLLTDSHQTKIAANLERRQIGEQFKLLDAARLPDQPVGPTRAHVNAIGTLAGLSLGLVLVAVSSARSGRRVNNQPESQR